jgi:hypothetical protein
MMAVGLEDKIKSVPDNIVSKHKTINYTLKLVHENNGLQHVVYTLYPFNFVVGGHHVMTECYLLMPNEKNFSYIMVRP